jgi:hypothetical protein
MMLWCSFLVFLCDIHHSRQSSSSVFTINYHDQKLVIRITRIIASAAGFYLPAILSQPASAILIQLKSFFDVIETGDEDAQKLGMRGSF